MKKESKFYVKTTSGEFKITADYLKYEIRETGDTIFFKKKFKGKKNPEDGTYNWDVAFVKSAAVEEYGNVTSTAIIKVPRGCCFSVSVRTVSASNDPTVTPTPVVEVQNANFVIDRIA